MCLNGCQKRLPVPEVRAINPEITNGCVCEGLLRDGSNYSMVGTQTLEDALGNLAYCHAHELLEPGTVALLDRILGASTRAPATTCSCKSLPEDKQFLLEHFTVTDNEALAIIHDALVECKYNLELSESIES